MKLILALMLAGFASGQSALTSPASINPPASHATGGQLLFYNQNQALPTSLREFASGTLSITPATGASGSALLITQTNASQPTLGLIASAGGYAIDSQGDILPDPGLTYNLGNNALYWLNTYTQFLWLGSVTGSTQCLEANSLGEVIGAGGACAVGSAGVTSLSPGTRTGALTLESLGGTVTITSPDSSHINFEVAGSVTSITSSGFGSPLTGAITLVAGSGITITNPSANNINIAFSGTIGCTTDCMTTDTPQTVTATKTFSVLQYFGAGLQPTPFVGGNVGDSSNEFAQSWIAADYTQLLTINNGFAPTISFQQGIDGSTASLAWQRVGGSGPAMELLQSIGFSVLTMYGSITPNASLSGNLGSGSLYWNNTYSNNVFLGSVVGTTQCLEALPSGQIIGTGSVCGGGGGGGGFPTGAWTPYSPSTINLSGVTADCAYNQQTGGKTVFVSCRVTGTSNGFTPQISLPVQPVDPARTVFNTTLNQGGGTILGLTNTSTFGVGILTYNNTALAPVFTAIIFSGTYESI